MQHSITIRLQNRFEWLQHCSNIATMCPAWNRRFESSRVKIGNNATATRTTKKKQTMGLISKTATSHVRHAFHISLPLLHYYDVKMPHFTFNGERKEAMTKLYLSLWTWIWSLGLQLQEGSSRFDKVSRRVVLKTERTKRTLISTFQATFSLPSRLWILRIVLPFGFLWSTCPLSVHSRFSSFPLVTRKY